MAQEGWKLEQEEPPCTPPAAAPSLCLNNCGFFGSTSTMNLCSSCYKSLVLLKPQSPAEIPPSLEQEESKSEPSAASALLPSLLPSHSSPSPLPSPLPPSSSPCVTAANAPILTSTSADAALCSNKAQPLRCFACQKKVGLRGFKCRCGDVFCSLHRYTDKHACSYDYKAAGRASIAKANPLVKADKLHRI